MSSDSQELFFIFSYNKNAENNGNRDGNENIKRRRMALFHIIKRICSFASSIVWSVFIQMCIRDRLRTIDKKRLKDKVCHLDREVLQKVDQALKISLELDT